MSLAFEVQDAFFPDGVLSRATENFMPRRGQTAMALAIACAIEGGYSLVVGASTRVGKTFSYLVKSLPELVPGGVCRLEAFAHVLAFRVSFFHDSTGVIAQVRHAQGIV